jgi:phosphatidylserine/phosphatidylglycerophosphate/cardiolipin synthase-like enzyme
MGKLQHNKTIVVSGKVQAAVCGSTNHSWRGFFVQNNNAIILRGKKPVEIFMGAFEDYKANENDAGVFGKTGSATWNKLGIAGIDAEIGFSPRSGKNAVLDTIAKDIATTTSSLFFSLAFLYQTKGKVRNAFTKIKKDNKIFLYGISDHKVEGLEAPAGVDVAKANGQVAFIHPEALTKNVPEPFYKEAKGGSGTRMHHKFVVIDFDKPTARVYMGSYNFSVAADTSNGENLLLIRDRRIAVSYVVEALRMFDHFEFRVAQTAAKKARKKLQLTKPPRKAGERAWWAEDYSNPRKMLDRKLFA